MELFPHFLRTPPPSSPPSIAFFSSLSALVQTSGASSCIWLLRRPSSVYYGVCTAARMPCKSHLKPEHVEKREQRVRQRKNEALLFQGSQPRPSQSLNPLVTRFLHTPMRIPSFHGSRAQLLLVLDHLLRFVWKFESWFVCFCVFMDFSTV